MMTRNFLLCVSLLVFLVVLGGTDSVARTALGNKPGGYSPTASAGSAYGIAAHNIGKINLSVVNNGTFGLGLSGSAGNTDFFTGEQVRSCEYPKGSRTSYLFAGALWIGAVLGRDTLVSTAADGWSTSAAEFHPEVAPLGNMIFRSTIDPAKPEFDGAISEQDYIAVYYDTCLTCPGVDPDERDGRPHRPLHLEVTQRTFAWSYEYAEDFVLFDFGVRNIGHDRLRKVYMGLYVDADIHALSNTDGYSDDLCGFREYLPALYLPEYCLDDHPDTLQDIVNIAYTQDNNGDLNQLTHATVPHITATRIVRTPSDSLEVSFNWWISNGNASRDFGPMQKDNIRDLGHGGSGTPTGDRNKFYVLSNAEFDYEQVRVASIDALDSVWQQPIGPVNVWATGLDTRYCLSFGPFDIEPGQTLPISLSYVGGENFHNNPANYDFLAADPRANWETYYNALNFTDLGKNATWSDWIYDNPGVDSDSDGYAGEYIICEKSGEPIFDSLDTLGNPVYSYLAPDTIYIKGDGVPDFQGASPPPAPIVRVEPSPTAIRVLFNGLRSETENDAFTRERDFEGYRVYMARDGERASYTMLASYDIEDYNKWVWDEDLERFLLLESPLTPDSLGKVYGDSLGNFDPLAYSRLNPFDTSGFDSLGNPWDSVFYFVPQDFNRSVLGHLPGATTPIRKIYPDAPKPTMLEWEDYPDGDTTYLIWVDGYDEPLFKYYEYEYSIENLLPTIGYWINVTAFDYGSPRTGLPALETNPTINARVTFAMASSDDVINQKLKVYVYPNPYRQDAHYRARGFEGRGEDDIAEDRTRAINFVNLPAKCTIRIFSLDGDLVREIIHDVDPTNPNDPEADKSAHDTWDLITRNAQLVVSGIYYWTVEDENGQTQIGKLVIIL